MDISLVLFFFFHGLRRTPEKNGTNHLNRTSSVSKGFITQQKDHRFAYFERQETKPTVLCSRITPRKSFMFSLF